MEVLTKPNSIRADLFGTILDDLTGGAVEQITDGLLGLDDSIAEMDAALAAYGARLAKLDAGLVKLMSCVSSLVAECDRESIIREIAKRREGVAMARAALCVSAKANADSVIAITTTISDVIA